MQKKPETDFYSEMQAEMAASKSRVLLLRQLADLREEHLCNADLAAQLIAAAGGDWKQVVAALGAIRDAISAEMRLMIYAVALEGKEREQQPKTKE
jgi:hypothetical protein